MEELHRLFLLYQRDVYLYLYSLSRDADLSEELTAETFFEAVRSLGAFRGEADIKTWLFSIARHRWFAYLRKKKREPRTELLDELAECGGPSLEDRVCDRAAARRAEELIAGETPRTRTIVMLRLEGLSFHEIGLRCGVSENSARVIDFRARARIRAVLKEEGFTDE